ncbi:TRAP transporter small permease subunit [Rhizobium pusense]|uniref:TRAP transporter small permease n=1 Tax=Agrobacterium pusense TaxID=648995 RepID=UPI001FCDA08E|nr:TRAP transporter small permease [Agrobacterium pusense]MCJ2877395.1 TRAP transporter small permease subunit [Agrobacterium pusense]
MFALLTRGAGGLAHLLALIGGLVLLFLICLTCMSIMGRALTIVGVAPIQGDFEWVEIGIGFAIFCFMPYCQYVRAHATVDLLEPVFAVRINRLMELVTDMALLAFGVLMVRQLYLGMLDKREFGETTFILQLPTWKAYLAALLPVSLGLLISAFCMVRSLISLKTGSRGDVHVAH